MSTIKITCETCNTVHEVERTKEIPNNVISLGCNWCPLCEEKAQEYYYEWYNYDDSENTNKDNNIPDNQLCIPFIFNEILKYHDTIIQN